MHHRDSESQPSEFCQLYRKNACIQPHVVQANSPREQKVNLYKLYKLTCLRYHNKNLTLTASLQSLIYSAGDSYIRVAIATSVATATSSTQVEWRERFTLYSP